MLQTIRVSVLKCCIMTTETPSSLNTYKKCAVPMASSLNISLQYCLAAASRLFIRRPEQGLAVSTCKTKQQHKERSDLKDEPLPECPKNWQVHNRELCTSTQACLSHGIVGNISIPTEVVVAAKPQSSFRLTIALWSTGTYSLSSFSCTGWRI